MTKGKNGEIQCPNMFTNFTNVYYFTTIVTTSVGYGSQLGLLFMPVNLSDKPKKYLLYSILTRKMEKYSLSSLQLSPYRTHSSWFYKWRKLCTLWLRAYLFIWMNSHLIGWVLKTRFYWLGFLGILRFWLWLYRLYLYSTKWRVGTHLQVNVKNDSKTKREKELTFGLLLWRQLDSEIIHQTLLNRKTRPFWARTIGGSWF